LTATLVLSACAGNSATLTPTANGTGGQPPSAYALPSAACTPVKPPPVTAGTIYVGNGDSDILAFAAGPDGTLNEAPLATIGGKNTGFEGTPFGLAVDPRGKIYASIHLPSPYAYSRVSLYAQPRRGTNDEAPLATITGSDTGLHLPTGIALDPGGRIYVANLGTVPFSLPSITVFTPDPSGTLDEVPLATITGSNTGLEAPGGLALDASDNIYVANYDNAITVYAAHPSGTLDEKPLATITGSRTGLDHPNYIALDRSGRVYVTNGGNDTVTVYAAHPSGTLDEAPVATIGGKATELNGPTGIALDKTGKVYVANALGSIPNFSITVYAAGPNGNLDEAPVGTIRGCATNLANPRSLFIH
jgi:sugar lactone lactonase YvrE